MGGCLEAQGRYAGDAELDVDDRAGDRSSPRGLQEAGRRDGPVQGVAGADHGCVVGAGQVAGADRIAEAAGAGGRVIAPGVGGAGIEADRGAADGAQREIDGCELAMGGARLDLAGKSQAQVTGPWRLNRLAWRAGDAVNQCRGSGSRAAGWLRPVQRDAQRGLTGMVKRDLDRARAGAAVGTEPGEPPDGVAVVEGCV